MKIFDKAAWQIDNGVSKETVIRHFTLMFNWLNDKGLLNADGKEILDIGIGEDASLNDRLVTDEGADFLNKYYDDLIIESEYNTSVEQRLIEEKYNEFKK